MLRKLEVQNFALIEQATIDFNQGFHAITGETGSGKSILLGALNLILGERADYSVIRNSESKTVVEATFLLQENYRDWFTQEDIDFEPETIIRREITSQGKSRAFINDSPVQLSQLKDLTEQLIYIHSQHETLEIRKPSFQFQLLDAFSNQTENSSLVKQEYFRLQQLKRQHKSLVDSFQKHIQEKDFISFQLNELLSLDLENKNYEEIEKQYQKFSQSDELKQVFESIHFELEAENGPIDSLRRLKILLDKYKNSDSDVNMLAERFLQVITELTDISKDNERLSNSLNVDEESVALLSISLDEYHKIAQKHRVSSQDDLKNILFQLETQTNDLSELEQNISSIENEIELCSSRLVKLADDLFLKRKESIPELQIKLIDLLSELKMEHTVIQLALEKASEMDAFGGMTIQLLFSANKGLATKPIDKVASGGELSRLMLAIQLILSGNKSLPTLILDEIDSGVSGEVALRIGKLLKQMGENIQLLAITHLPQVAAAAKTHYEVKKSHESDATLTSIKQLNKEARVEALAKLIAGDKLSSSSMSSAIELLDA